MKRGYLISLLGVAAIVAVSIWLRPAVKTFAGQGWGIDACLTAHLQPGDRSTYLKLLANSGVRVLRERSIGRVAGTLSNPGTWHRDVREDYRLLKKNGFAVVAFTHLPFSTRKPQSGNQLPEDLRQVHQQGQFLGREFAGLVDAWEMVGEPDIGYCTDLPDRVAAYQKALYLGLKAGGKERLLDESYRLSGAQDARAKARLVVKSSKLNGPGTDNFQRSPNNGTIGEPIVLMGALGMPPGPWLERFTANDGLAYTDAYNFHFYGHAEQLTGVIAAHRAAVRALLDSAKAETGWWASVSIPATGDPRERRSVGMETDAHPTASLRLSAKRKGHGEHVPQLSAFRSQLSAAASPLPLWITEAGLAAVDKNDFLNPQRRQLQADFTLSTAKQALAVEDVAVFMPFILVHDKDPYAMTLSPWKAFPAWDAYAKFTRENPWPRRPLAREPHEPNPVVVQWLPDNRTTLPHKVSGTYRFKGDAPIKGELRIYNFGEQERTGKLEMHTLKHAVINRRGVKPLPHSIQVPAMGMVSVPLEFTPTGEGYFRETWSAAFVEVGRVVPHAPKEAFEGGLGTSRPTFVSRVSFGLEAWAKLTDFVEEPLPLRALQDGVIRFPQLTPYVAGEQVGVWSTMNGLKGGTAKDGGQAAGDRQRTAEDGKLKADIGRQTSGIGLQTSGGESSARFWIEKKSTDPRAPRLAVAGVDGLPAKGFLRLQLDKPMAKDRKVLVVLVDDRGQRYSIWENFSADYYGSRSDVWLNLEDFHADFKGPMSTDYRFRAERIREVHLRLYLDNPNDPVQVGLTLLKAKQGD